MRFLGRVAANAGLSITVGATMLGSGIALGAMGVDRANAARVGLLNSPLFILGLVLGSMGLGWLVLSLVVALVSTAKTDRFRDQLAEAIRAGEGLPKPLQKHAVEAWATATRDLIRSALGEADVRRFLSDAGYTSWGSDHTKNYWIHRLERLNELIERPGIRASLSFDAQRDWFQSSSPAVSESAQM